MTEFVNMVNELVVAVFSVISVLAQSFYFLILIGMAVFMVWLGIRYAVAVGGAR